MKHLFRILAGLTFALIGFQAHALVLTGLSYTNCMADPACYWGPSGPPADNPSISDLQATILAQGGPAVSLFELYKENVGDGFDSGSFAASYETDFFNTPSDPQAALIRYISGNSVSCPECFLLVKDGASLPNWYLFDIGSWNGTDNIAMTGFWTGPGSISHVSIYATTGGTDNRAPEPGVLILVAAGLLGIGFSRRRKLS